MKLLTTLHLFIIFSHFTFSQKSTENEFSVVDKIALQIPLSSTKSTDQIAKYINMNFTSDNNKSRAAFIWVASNITYDVPNMYAVNIDETKEDRIAKTLNTRKGICENYATLLTEILTKVGIKSFVVAGFTKQNTTIDLLSHAWNAALIDGSWYLFDPTWGSGYVNGGKFTKNINNKFYKVRPENSIKSHMPYDYMWQFLDYPITSQEFYDGKTQQNKNKEIFNYKEFLSEYEKQTEVEQLKSSVMRIKKNGVKNKLISEQLKFIKLEIENIQHNQIVDRYNVAIALYNEGIAGYNDFIYFRNKQFKPERTDNDIQAMIDNAANNLEKAKTILRETPATDDSKTSMIKQLKSAVDQAAKNVAEQQAWLKSYLSKGKLARKSMFFERKVSIFGVTIN